MIHLNRNDHGEWELTMVRAGFLTIYRMDDKQLIDLRDLISSQLKERKRGSKFETASNI